ncbi:MAG: hypothetical protein HYY61_01475 [Deltaproteobacteria bacterium]|nr:hypothetical protein [Deltaproteobacteria bacterium]
MLKVLLIDDSKTIQKVARLILQGTDFFLSQAGADGKLAKPFNSEEFLALLRELRVSKNALEPQLVVPMPPDPFKSLFDEEELDKHLEFLEKPVRSIPHYSDDGKRVDSLPRETVEKVCREIIPPLAEKIIREEIQKLLKDKD